MTKWYRELVWTSVWFVYLVCIDCFARPTPCLVNKAFKAHATFWSTIRKLDTHHWDLGFWAWALKYIHYKLPSWLIIPDNIGSYFGWTYQPASSIVFRASSKVGAWAICNSKMGRLGNHGQRCSAFYIDPTVTCIAMRVWSFTRRWCSPRPAQGVNQLRVARSGGPVGCKSIA